MTGKTKSKVESGTSRVEGKQRLGGKLESKLIRRHSYADYRQFIQKSYDGLPGAVTAITGWVNGHESLAGRLIRPDAFDIRGSKRVLDAGCGNGRYSRFLLKQADPDALITAFDLSQRMLRRARKRLRSSRVSHIAADLTRLPYADATFDCIVCGWVLEHLPDPRPGLESLARVLKPGGKLLLLATEDTLTVAMCSQMWKCRTYNRAQLIQVCRDCGLVSQRELWFSRLHALLRMGGIVLDLRKVET